MKVNLLAHHISWDTPTHEDSLGLPRKVEVEVDLNEQEGFADINRQICDQLSNMTGWLVLDYRLEGYSAEADYALQIRNFKEGDK
jgi:hypothetical protein